jgi:hypothetical protein
VPLVHLCPYGIDAMLDAVSDPQEGPEQSAAMRLLRNVGYILRNLCDERIYFPDVRDERFERLIEVILKMRCLRQMLRLAVQLRGCQHRDRQMRPHINQFGMFDNLAAFSVVHHRDPHSRKRDIFVLLLNARVLPQGIAHGDADNAVWAPAEFPARSRTIAMPITASRGGMALAEQRVWHRIVRREV